MRTINEMPELTSMKKAILLNYSRYMIRNLKNQDKSGVKFTYKLQVKPVKSTVQIDVQRQFKLILIR
jgi:hypothetical protein